MAAGEAWIFDTWRSHNVVNASRASRVHLVIDTTGSDTFWHQLHDAQQTPRLIAFDPQVDAQPRCERFNFPTVMSPWELKHLSDQVCAAMPQGDGREAMRVLQTQLHRTWRGLWSEFADSHAGYGRYAEALDNWNAALDRMPKTLLDNGVDAAQALRQWIGRAALHKDDTGATAQPSRAPQHHRPAASRSQGTNGPRTPHPESPAHSQCSVSQPVFIVAAPRSGSTLLFETLAQAANVYTVGGESHGILEQFPALTPAQRGHASNRLTADDADAHITEALPTAFAAALRDRNGQPPPRGAAARMLEKTPKNALRISFLARVFPGARFIYLHRDPAANIGSIIDAWESHRFITYPHLPEWSGEPWSLLLIEGWRHLQGKSRAEVAAAQWRAANETILEDLAALPSGSFCTVSYAQFLQDPQKQTERLARFAGFAWDTKLNALPLSRHTLTPPAPDKWRKHERAITPLLQTLQPLRERIAAVENPDTTPQATCGSVHTTTFAPFLREAQASVLVSTYQAGKVVILRGTNEGLNTHFRDFDKPMGLALDRGRLAIGTTTSIQRYHNVPAVAARLPGERQHDACFVPRSGHVTGDVAVHELAWSGDELWFVNTAFSCLCTLHADYSFVPRWRPSFIDALAPEDRCHLNGMALVEGKPRYVTALGTSNHAGGWRARKHDGGVVIDIDNDTIVARGLCMPHSPRWHAGKLWVLNSGQGGLGVIDLQSGAYHEVARLPGFTRGLDFIGRYALVGLSQIRETATFNAVPLAKVPLQERACGVWVVDTVTGQTCAFTKFIGTVQEIFAVQAALGVRYPELLAEDPELTARAYVLPDAALVDVPQALRSR